MEDYLQSEEESEDDEEWDKSFLDNSSLINSAFSSKHNSARQVNLDNPSPINSNSTSKLNSTRQIKHPRCIIHIDIDCFYAQVEMIKNPELQNVPMGVKQKNLIVTTNYPARNKGVPKSCWIPDALKICPDLVLINGEDLHDYRQYSQRIFELLKSFKVPVEKLGLDENFLDVTSLVLTEINSLDCDDVESVSPLKGHCFRSRTETVCKCGCDHRLKIASNIAQQIRDKLFDELSITTSAGIAYNKLVSKMIGSRHKPNDQTTIFPCDVTGFLDEVSDVRKLPGIGSVTTRKLKENGLCKISDIVNCDKERIRHLFSSDPIVASKILNFCSGIDDSAVVMSQPAKSIGVEDRFKGINKRDQCVTHLEWLFDRLCLLIHEDGRMPTVIKISARDSEKARRLGNKFMRETRQAKISPNLFKSLTTDSKLEPVSRDKVLKLFTELLGKIVDLNGQFWLTLLGVSVTGFYENEKYDHQGKRSITSFFGDCAKPTPSQSLLPQQACFFDQKKRNLQDDGEHDLPPVKVACLMSNEEKHATDRISSFENYSSTTTTTTTTTTTNRTAEASITPIALTTTSNTTTTTSTIPPATRVVSMKATSNITFPTDWDKEIFKQLPLDVQQELLKSADISNLNTEKFNISKNNSNNKNNNNNTKNNNTKSNNNNSNNDKKTSSKKSHIQPIRIKTSSATIQTSFNKSNNSKRINELFDKSSSSNSTKDSSSIDCNNNNTNNSYNYNDDNDCSNSKNSAINNNKNNNNNNSDNSSHNNNNNTKTLLSSNWDEDVFQQLPPDLQQELLAASSQQKNHHQRHQNTQKKKQTSTTSKTKTKQNDNRIFNYFQKK